MEEEEVVVVEGNEGRLLEKEEGENKKKTKKNVRTTAIPPQPCNTDHNTPHAFTIHSLGEKGVEGETGEGGREKLE